ncbi:MAG: glycoside hydrolase family 16 protein, partial [Nannocystaceae bacterium]|nr:glycoside hydrolase family 16 protein [Nannocystaceae bacterium]
MTSHHNYIAQLLATLAASLGPWFTVCADTSPPVKALQWELTFSDEFDGPDIDLDKWEILTRKDSYNNEKQYYLPAQASIVDGMLRITATNEPHDGKAYRSARLESWFTQAYGRFEARAKLPTTKGIWPAFWLLPRTGEWPNNGEIDIMENAGSKPTTVQCASHFADDSGKHDHVYKTYSAQDADGKPVIFSEGFHLYAVEWSPEEMVFFVDN